MRQRIVLVVGAWLAGAAVTAAVATAAVNASGAGLLGPSNHPLTQSEVRRQLAASGPSGSPAATASAGPTSSAGVGPAGTPNSPTSPNSSSSPIGGGQGSGAPDGVTGVTRPLGTTGGTVVARCSGGQVTLVSWSPAQGYRVDDVDPGPAASARVKFKAGHDELRVTVVCTGGEPTVEVDTDDH